jgi:hypothetical protein
MAEPSGPKLAPQLPDEGCIAGQPVVFALGRQSQQNAVADPLSADCPTPYFDGARRALLSEPLQTHGYRQNWRCLACNGKQLTHSLDSPVLSLK